VPVNRERLAFKRLDDEVRYHAPVMRPHAWPIGIEDTDNTRVHAVGPVVGHDQSLGKAFCLVIDAAQPDGIYVAPVGFRLRIDQGIPVGFRRAREQKRLRFALASPSVLWVPGADLQGLYRQLEVVAGAGSEAKCRTASTGSPDEHVLGDVVLEKAEALVPIRWEMLSTLR